MIEQALRPVDYRELIVASFREGPHSTFAKHLGCAMQLSNGKADPSVVRLLLVTVLNALDQCGWNESAESALEMMTRRED